MYIYIYIYIYICIYVYMYIYTSILVCLSPGMIIPHDKHFFQGVAQQIRTSVDRQTLLPPSSLLHPWLMGVKLVSVSGCFGTGGSKICFLWSRRTIVIPCYTHLISKLPQWQPSYCTSLASLRPHLVSKSNVYYFYFSIHIAISIPFRKFMAGFSSSKPCFCG